MGHLRSPSSTECKEELLMIGISLTLIKHFINPKLRCLILITIKIAFSALVLMVWCCLYIIKPFKHVKLFLLPNRIGHLSNNTDILLRRLQLIPDNVFYIGIAEEKPANEQLLKMLKRKIFIIQNEYAYQILKQMRAISLWRESAFCEKLPFHTNEHYEFNNTKRNLYFTASEEKKGEQLLNKMGIDDNSWFICFHSRDNTYLDKEHNYFNREEWSYHDYRNSDINNYLDAAKYIASNGGFALRISHTVKEKLPNLNNPKIIDYASNYRTDFGDIYLHAKCKFSLGDTAGIWSLPTNFHVPVACVNWLCPFDALPFRKGDLFIPKKVWSIEEERFLSYREILDSDVCRFLGGHDFEKVGLILVENTAEEIFDLATEMNERLDGTLKSTKEDEKLQEKFRSLFKPHHRGYGSPARIGAKFLRQNKWLLE